MPVPNSHAPSAAQRRVHCNKVTQATMSPSMREITFANPTEYVWLTFGLLLV